MATIPSGTKFLGLAKTYPTKEKRSALINERSEYYTIDDIAATALPSYVETNDADLTLWCNGTGNIDSNTIYGDGVLIGNSTGESNTAIGKDSMEFNSTGSFNTAVGNSCLGQNVSGGYNTAIGAEAMFSNTSGLSNTAIGAEAMLSNTLGYNNTAVGAASLPLNIDGTENTAIGMSSLSDLSSGSYNTAVGAQTGGFLSTSGSSNSIFGYQATNAGFDGCVVLGAEAAATANNQFVVGSASTNAGTVVVGANTSTQYWNVKINGVDYKILLA
jgi:hypothetical protein